MGEVWESKFALSKNKKQIGLSVTRVTPLETKMVYLSRLLLRKIAVSSKSSNQILPSS